MASILVGILFAVKVPQAVLPVLFERAWETLLSRDYARFRAVQTGWTEAQVLTHLGRPYRVFHAGTQPSSYRIPGYAYPTRTISHALYTYYGSEPAVYIFFAPDHRVEKVVVVGS